MARLLLYNAYPGDRFSHVKAVMAEIGRSIEEISFAAPTASIHSMKSTLGIIRKDYANAAASTFSALGIGGEKLAGDE